MQALVHRLRQKMHRADCNPFGFDGRQAQEKFRVHCMNMGNISINFIVDGNIQLKIAAVPMDSVQPAAD